MLYSYCRFFITLSVCHVGRLIGAFVLYIFFVLIHEYKIGIMDIDYNANADAKEPDTSAESKHRESKNKGRGVKSSGFDTDNYTDTTQQNVSRSSETPEGLEPDMTNHFFSRER